MAEPILIPSDEVAEQKLFCAVLDDQQNLLAVAGVKPAALYNPRHKVGWRALLALHARDEVVSHETLLNELRVTGKLEDVGGEGGLLEIIMPSGMTPGDYTQSGARGNARVVLETYQGRLLIDLARKAAAGGYATRPDTWDEIADIRAEIEAVHAALTSGAFDAKTSMSASNTFPILDVKSLIALEPAKGIVGDILFEDSFAFLFGDSDTWKTFVALSLGLSMAAGKPWLGRPVKKGPVVYVAAEAARSIGIRVEAYVEYHGIQDAEFYVVPAEVNLLSDSEVGKLIKTIRTLPALDGRDPIAIFFDTLSRSMGGGDENGAPEGNQVTSAANRLRTTFNGANVTILHHNGHTNTGRMRGSSTYRDNADTVIMVKAPQLAEDQKREPGSPVTLHSVKAKGNTGFATFAFTTEKVEWTTEDGKTRDSLVVCATDAKPQVQRSDGLKDSERTALLALESETTVETGAWLLASGMVRSTFLTACGTLLARKYVDLIPTPDGGDKRKKWYRLTELGTTVQNRYKIGPDGPNGPEIGPDDGVGPISDEDATNPENSKEEIGRSNSAPLSDGGPIDLSETPAPEASEIGTLGPETLEASGPTYLSQALSANTAPSRMWCAYCETERNFKDYGDGLRCNVCDTPLPDMKEVS